MFIVDCFPLKLLFTIIFHIIILVLRVHMTYFSSRISKFLISSDVVECLNNVLRTSSHVSVEYSTSSAPRSSRTFPPNVLSQAWSNLEEQASFTLSKIEQHFTSLSILQFSNIIPHLLWQIFRAPSVKMMNLSVDQWEILHLNYWDLFFVLIENLQQLFIWINYK